ncbi:hypothetical protein H9P43_004641 [Blastocladiella emersonii ATCC 22665]|nr:hypothetical protein H9P43_004641 [Blastocladiella emersonii ATCC 22665]
MAASLLNLLVLALCVLSATAAPATTTPAASASALTGAGKLLSPGLTKFDYAMFQNDMTPEQSRALASIMSQEADDDLKTTKLMNALAFAPSRPTLASAGVEEIKDLALFASIPYCGSPATLSTLSCGKKCLDWRARNTRVVATLAGDATLGFVAVRAEAKQVVVSFRGSNNIQNWLDNLELYRIPYPFPKPASASDVWVHKGFVDAYNAVRAQMLASVKSAAAANPDFEVVFTGHSLGGALATMAATDAVNTGTVPASRVQLTSFASPRVGNGGYSAMVGSTGFAAMHRVTEGNDIVPHVPPQFMGYTHTVGEHYVLNGRIYQCSGQEDGGCSNSRVPFLSVLAHARFFGQDNFFGPLACIF